MTESRSGSVKKPEWVLYFLLFLFASPFAVSWWMYHFTELGRDGGAFSHGQLILPPRPVEDMMLYEPGAGMRGQRLHGKWNLLYIINGDCGKRCEQRLTLMRQLWLATGNDSHRLQRVLMVNDNRNNALISEQLKKYNGQLMIIMGNSASEKMADLFRVGPEDKNLDADQP